MPDATTPPEATPIPPQIPQAEIDSGKTMAILSYIPIAALGLIISIVCVAQKNNAFSLYHAKQALTLYICAIAAYVVCIPLIFVCVGGPLMVLVGLATLVLCVLGIVNANNGQCKPLPWLGQFADKWFGKIQKA
jgi:uncharacterized membrane protein